MNKFSIKEKLLVNSLSKAIDRRYNKKFKPEIHAVCFLLTKHFDNRKRVLESLFKYYSKVKTYEVLNVKISIELVSSVVLYIKSLYLKFLFNVFDDTELRKLGLKLKPEVLATRLDDMTPGQQDRFFAQYGKETSLEELASGSKFHDIYGG